MGDLLELRGLRVVGSHGCLPEEKERAQPFELDLDIEFDMAPAAASDAVADTVDYGGIVDAVGAMVAGEHFSLLETLAEQVARVVLEDVRVRSVMVAVRKLRPPVAADLATAGVRITRARG